MEAEKKNNRSHEISCGWRTRLAVIGVLLALAMVFVFAVRHREQAPEPAAAMSLEVPIDEVAREMIAGFEGFSFAVTNREHVVNVGNFAAKRVSAVDGRMRVNFSAMAYEWASGGRWEASVLVEFTLAGDGSRLRGDNVAVRRIHIYDMPKTVGNDELENNPEAVAAVRGRVRPSKEVVSDSQRVVDVKLTTDDTVKITWENTK